MQKGNEIDYCKVWSYRHSTACIGRQSGEEGYPVRQKVLAPFITFGGWEGVHRSPFTAPGKEARKDKSQLG